jgi:hypothetical protein
MIAMLLLGVTVSATVAEGPYALVVARVPTSAGPVAPVTLPADFAAIATALGQPGPRLALPLGAAVEGPGDALTPVPVQFDPAAPDALAGDLTLLLPGGSGSQRVRVYFTADRPNLPAPAVAALGVSQEGGAVTVGNEHYRFTHDPAQVGGLPSRIEFVQTGKVCDTFTLNDRVHESKVGGFRLAEDPQPRIEVLSSGPLRACVQVTARYLREGQAPESEPQAEYRFTYYAGSPLIRVAARLTQKQAFGWPELHQWEFNFPDQSFTRWLTGDPEAAGDLIADKESHTGNPWTGLADGDSVLAVVGQMARIYDGRGEYGTYLHGPWVSWSSPEERLQVTLWAGSVGSAEAAATLRAAAEAARAVQTATLTIQPLEDQLAAMDAAIAGLPRSEEAHWRWLAGLSRRAGTGGLTESIATARRLTELATRRAPFAEADRLVRQATGICLTVLSNEAVGWAFGQFEGTLRPVSCFDFSTQRELLSASNTPVWELTLERPGEGTTVVSAAASSVAQVHVSGARAQLQWTLPADLSGATVRATVALDGPASAWNLTVEDLRPGWGVREVAFPQVAVGPLSDQPEDDYLLFPQGSGVLKRAPLSQTVEFAGMYPDGWCSFQLMAYYDRQGGLYAACHDPLGATKRIITRPSGDRLGQVLTYQWYAPDMGVPGNGFATSAPTVLRAYAGDWFDATQLYRAWAEKEAQWWPRETQWDRPDTPQWMREVCVWACTGGASSECVQKVKDFAAFMGAPTAFHWYTWHEIPFDVKYPHYFPAKPGMAEGVKELQEAGVRVMPYINGRLWDTQLEDFQQSGIAAATKGEDGQPYIEEYGSGAKLAPMCPTQRLWQDTVNGIVVRLTTEVGVDGVYIDQIGAAAPRLCMDATHGHPLGGGHWWTQDGYWPMLTDLQARLPAGKMITTECNAEPYARWFDGYLTWHWQNQDMVPAFSAIYAGRIQLFSRSYGGDDQQAHCMKIGQQLVYGEQLGWLEPAKILPHEETADFMRRAAQTRHKLLDFLAWGRMARPPRVEGSIPELTADWAWGGTSFVTDSALQKGAWWAEDGRLLLLLANTSSEPVAAELVFDPRTYGWDRNAKVTVAEQTLDGVGQPVAETGRFRRALEFPARGIVALVVRP